MHTSTHTIATLTAVAAVGMSLALAVGAFAQNGERRSVRDGVFSAAQVEAGRKIFESICVNCHEVDEFTGAGAYLEDVDGKPLWETFDYIWSEMPEDDPSSLEPQDYAAVLSYLFSVYGLPVGNSDLPVDRASLETITIVKPALAGG
jgi:mono/diheme cytochrome c family protein